ncbi:MAG: hypothetical protein Q7R43_05135, partial [Candidatus Daviesbacteria bacterium]|nr:hypothetical protein [Candidatus Daviesbacteria bacterium]
NGDDVYQYGIYTIGKRLNAYKALLSIAPTPTPSCPSVACDINGDGSENSSDGNLVKGCWNKPATGACQKVDVRCDGKIKIDDIQSFSYRCPQIFTTPTPTPRSLIPKRK